MPKVGRREFEYSPEGEKAAQKEAAKTGKPVERMQRYQAGGLLKRGSGKPKQVETRGVGAATRGTKFYTR